MSTKLTGCVLLAKSVLLLLDCSAKKTAALCGYNSKKSWLLAVEKARKEAMTKKATKKSSKKPIALLCPASDKVVKLKDVNRDKERSAENMHERDIIVF